MPSFFELPESVRYRVYYHLIHSSLDQSSSLSIFHANDRYQRLFRHGSSLTESKIESAIKYPSRIYLPYEGFLRVNSQARSEMKEAIQKSISRKVNCSLDLVVECEHRLYPTWLRCPSRSPTVQRLDVDVRLLGFAAAAEIGACEHTPGRGRCRTLAFAIVAILARFVERGARFEHARGELEVHTIALNFSSKGASKFLQLTPVLSTETSEDWDTDTLVDGDVEGVSPANPNDVVDGPMLLRMVDLVLKPLCRQPQYLLRGRRSHYSTSHLILIRRNVRRVFLELDGKVERKIYINNSAD
ncbi:hypothetical protein EJ08DRAFT_644878 [Tothia fuscella]|uniref:Uncharacterized protein n=1 Tax=Tothia fuscella TaxID=1048955 RepID=A0A9P4P4P1_9PEZI|nr:hypothetical protein EJ08DRAFT_644878 [Tothia fuscella]